MCSGDRPLCTRQKHSVLQINDRCYSHLRLASLGLKSAHVEQLPFGAIYDAFTPAGCLKGHCIEFGVV